ncbi:TraB/GumN family protein [Ferruginibacter albus]|uniref:TraB/GumN family protein n=1 Tax=Ferruginibacter albus TaxID=2875540 RepID=UPI001CC6742A|nr:TraB/GumN family protein [Ferruginibacter albus]UAY51717.1 TraB/GumN family protein [Ferruginibacter albus]
MKKTLLKVILLIITIVTCTTGFGQKKSPSKYSSLFWEITGNGLKKPSYLFGTMHVSSKMVFHLSDSFYTAIKNVDAVALELNPQLWQSQMVEMDKMKENYTRFTQKQGNDYLNESSFRITKYEDELKAALSTEPPVVNSLLYRTYQSQEDFEEDTFLDLYIYQTGRKLGKRAAGVENYYETEKLIMDAYVDMHNEKKKKTIDTDGASMMEIQDKIQEAYRHGDLDLMDSLDNMIEVSDAFNEKFLYKRNEIQANSIDTILKKSSLFVGVGAAHLPGSRGVIELLRAKGYKLRPIKMIDKEAMQKDAIDKIKVPVVFNTVKADDGFYSVDVPGSLAKTSDDHFMNRKQFADMNNGSYYMVTRVKTYAAFNGQSEKDILKKVDSLLYENIPGKILSKKIITKNGYSGYDITNKTRRGNVQRYNIFVTPYEVIIFKMSGNEDYVKGTEAERYFNSIQLKEATTVTTAFSPKQGGFSIQFPQTPLESFNTNTTDEINRWEYEAVNKTTGDGYLVFKKNVNNFSFLDEDTFDLKLMEESFRSSDIFERQLQRKLSSFNGYPCLDVQELLKDSSVITARFIIKGPAYYAIAARSADRSKDFSDFIRSFKFVSNQYAQNKNYIDTFLNYSVTTPVIPQIDESLRSSLEKMNDNLTGGYYGYSSSYYQYWPDYKYAWFCADSTGTAISVSFYQYPKYYSIDTANSFYARKFGEYKEENSMLVSQKDSFTLANGTFCAQYTLTDTGSSRTMRKIDFLKDDRYFELTTIGDTLSKFDAFTDSFLHSFSPDLKKPGRNIFVSATDSFLTDLFSIDSATRSKAQKSLSSIDFEEKDAGKLYNAIYKLKATDKDYIDTKTNLITALGNIKDTTKPVIVDQLKKIYEQVGDTSLFQNAVISSLASHKTKEATLLFKQLVLQDPPVFDNNYDYSGLFRGLNDTLALGAKLFPEILQLTSLDDYKEPITSLLVTLVDSGFIKANQYESYFSKFYFDAKIELKKQQTKEQLASSKKTDEDDNDNSVYRDYGYDEHKDELYNYAVLLMPFYDKNPNIPKYFTKLLQSSNQGLLLNTAVLLLRNNKTVADSLLLSLASDDQYRSELYRNLKEIKQLKRFPEKYKTQEDIARSVLLEGNNYSKIDSIVFLTKQHVYYKEKGIVYFFKYRIKKEDDWKIGISGLQPEKEDSVSTDGRLTSMTDKKYKEDDPRDEQLQKQLKKLLFGAHPSARNFFYGDDTDYLYKRMSEYGN